MAQMISEQTLDLLIKLLQYEIDLNPGAARYVNIGKRDYAALEAMLTALRKDGVQFNNPQSLFSRSAPQLARARGASTISDDDLWMDKANEAIANLNSSLSDVPNISFGNLSPFLGGVPALTDAELAMADFLSRRTGTPVDFTHPFGIENAVNDLIQQQQILQNNTPQQANAGSRMPGSGYTGGGGSGGGVTLIGPNGFQKLSQDAADGARQAADTFAAIPKFGYGTAGTVLKTGLIIGVVGAVFPAAIPAFLGSSWAISGSMLNGAAALAAGSALVEGFGVTLANGLAAVVKGGNKFVQGKGAEQAQQQAQQLEKQRAQLEAAFQLEVKAQELAAEYGIPPKRAVELAAGLGR